MSLNDIQNQRVAYQDSLLERFVEELRRLVQTAQARVIATLQRQLSITDGVIDQTPANIRLLRNLNNLYMRELDRLGLDELLRSFVDSFQAQIKYVDQILRFLSDQMQTPLPRIRWTGSDRDVLTSLQGNSVSSLETAIETVAAEAMKRTMFSVGGLKFGDLVATLTEKFETSIGVARTIGDTAMTTFYRTANDRAFQQIEATQKELLKYRYSGPEDKLERPFCRRLTDADRSYTREQINRMDNGQLPNVFITGGGYNCRHQWIIDTRDLEVRAMEAA
jgi:hypothetical protein